MKHRVKTIKNLCIPVQKNKEISMKLFLTALLIACSISLSFSAEGLGDSNRTKELVENLSDSYDFWMSFDKY